MVIKPSKTIPHSQNLCLQKFIYSLVGKGSSMHTHILGCLKSQSMFSKHFNIWSPAESPVLIQTLSKLHIPRHLSGTHIPVLLSSLSQTSEDQSSDSQVSMCFSLKNSVPWENGAQSLTHWAGCSSKLRHQTYEYR